MSTTNARASDLRIVYDGDCPLCRSFMLYYRLRDLGVRTQLIDARSDDPLVATLKRQGVDLDHGMVVEFEGRTYYGANAMHLLALLGSGDTVFNRANRFLFRHRSLAHFLYPALVRGRHLLLFLLGRPPIDRAWDGEGGR